MQFTGRTLQDPEALGTMVWSTVTERGSMIWTQAAPRHGPLLRVPLSLSSVVQSTWDGTSLLWDSLPKSCVHFFVPKLRWTSDPSTTVKLVSTTVISPSGPSASIWVAPPTPAPVCLASLGMAEPAKVCGSSAGCPGWYLLCANHQYSLCVRRMCSFRSLGPEPFLSYQQLELCPSLEGCSHLGPTWLPLTPRLASLGSS